MKKSRSLPLLSLTALLFTHQALAVQTCSQKEAALNEQLRVAEQHNNPYQITGLKKALAEVQRHCTAQSVREDATQDVQKLKRKLADKQHDLQGAKDDLHQASSTGSSEKVTKYQRKVAEKTRDVNRLTQQLADSEKGLAGLK